MQTQEGSIIDRGGPLVDRDRFEIYKNSQQEQLLGRQVLMSALRKPEVKDIPIVRERTQNSDPVDWLAGKLSVSFPGKAEIMMVSLSLEDPKEAKSLVNAVVDSYMTDVVYADNETKKTKYDEAERICSEKEQQIRTKREELKNLVGSAAGGSDPELVGIKLKMILEELALYRTQAAQASYELGKVNGELEAQKALLKNVDEAEVPEMEIDVLIQTDPVAKQLSAELGWKKIDESYNEGARKKGGPNAYADQYHDQVERLQKQFDERRALLEKKARQKKSSLIKSEVIRLEAVLQPLTDGQKAAKTKIDEREELAKSLSQTSVDIQMIQAQLRNLDQVMANFVNEKEKLGAEIKSTPRIRVQEMAEEPPIPSNTLRDMR